MNWFRSLSFRLAVGYAALFTVSIALLLGAYFWVNVHRPLQTVRATIAMEAEDFAQIYMVDGKAALLGGLTKQAGKARSPKFYAAWVQRDGTTHLFNLPALPGGMPEGWSQIDADIYRYGLEQDQLALLSGRRFADGNSLYVGRDIEVIHEVSEQIGTAAAWVIPLTLFLGLSGGLLMSRVIGQRIDGIARAAQSVMAGDLSGRVPLTGGGDDFDQLSVTLNTMLENTQQSFERVLRVSDHVAHELRTPLARLSAGLETARLRADKERDQALESGLTETLRLQAIVDSLLRISRLENGVNAVRKQPLDLSRIVADVAEFYAPEAEARGISFTCNAPQMARMDGDPNLIFQALSNLLDNALKFTPKGGHVMLSCHETQDGWALSVNDDGVGIESDEEGRLTERFYRSRSAVGHDGVGLGLTLVAAIAKLHNGRVAFQTNNPGLRASIYLTTK